ncbi:glycosyltransferase family 2 protein [Alistipes sp.]|uniref:glycosyltransferase family 2 protein n=1 Tax=Alistipes sp. TaxID=1872444 RepID=UPI003AF1DF9D
MLISIIIPVFKAEKYISECIESVLRQTMSDFELILIDDGSPDASGAICDRYAREDDRIRVFHNPNQGVSQARNCGLNNAQGKFVVFIDADDWVEPTHLEQFVQSGIEEGGIAFTNLVEERSYMPDNSVSLRHYPMPDCSVPVGAGYRACMEVIAKLLRVRCFGWTCNKMFSRATIEKYNVRFDPNFRYAEDEIFTAQYCAHINHIVCNSNPTYHYRYVPTSLLRGQVDPHTLMRTRIHIYNVYERLGYSNEVLYLTARTQFSRLRRELRNSKWNSRLSEELTKGILENWKLYRKNSRARFCKGFYDTKALCIGWLSCAPRSQFWVKLVIKGLHM